MAESTVAGPAPGNNDCRMHEHFNFTCGTCNGLFDKHGNRVIDLAAPTPLANTDVANPPNNAQTGRPRSQ